MRKNSRKEKKARQVSAPAEARLETCWRLDALAKSDKGAVPFYQASAYAVRPEGGGKDVRLPFPASFQLSRNLDVQPEGAEGTLRTKRITCAVALSTLPPGPAARQSGGAYPTLQWQWP